MGGENKTTQTTSSSATPYPGAQPLVDTGLGDALTNYSRTKQGFDPVEANLRGADWLRDRAVNAIGADQMAPALTSFSSTFGKDGYNTAQRDAMSYLQPTARGDFLSLENPDFQRLLNKSMEDAATEASMVASGMGRSGSDFHQGTVAERVGDVAANARLGQYNLERDRQNSAIQSLFGMGQTGMGNMAMAGDVYQSLYDARTRPGVDLMALGQTGNTNIQNLLGAAQFASPFASMSGTGSTAQPKNTFGQIAGAGLGALSLFG